jgi:hypothetical protein
METGFKTKRNLATLLAGLSICSAATSADERFIVQPRFRQAIDSATESDSRFVQSSQPIAVRKSSVASDAGNMISILEPPRPQPTAGYSAETFSRANPSSATQSSATQSSERSNKLQWMPRRNARSEVPSASVQQLAPPRYELASRLTPGHTQPSTQPALESATVISDRHASTHAPGAPPNSQPISPVIDVADHRSPEPPMATTSKSTLASMISNQITASAEALSDSLPPVAPVDAPPGWEAVGRKLSQHMVNCESLIYKRAYLSAREEAEAAMLHLVRVLDLAAQTYASEPDWISARRAMLEAEDFTNAQRLTSDSEFLRRLILSHETPVLKKSDVRSLAPLAAAQHYRQYTERKLVSASQGHPWASEVLYILGRAYQAQADETQDTSKEALRWRAVTCYRSACSILPSNSSAANQLGFVMLQMDRPVDARDILLSSLRSQPTLSALENLIEASRRLGDASTRNWALQNYMAMKSTTPAKPNVPQVTEVPPQTFAALSPYAIGPHPQPQQATASTATPKAATSMQSPTYIGSSPTSTARY